MQYGTLAYIQNGQGWHSGPDDKAYRDWLSNRCLTVRIGEVLSDEILLASGVPHGSVISPFLWNYWLGDCSTTNHKAAHLSFYADDLSLWISHVSGIKSLDILNDEIRRLVNWTKRKRFYLEPTKSHALVFHKVLGKVTFGNESKDLVDVFSSLKLLVLLGAERGVNILQKAVYPYPAGTYPAYFCRVTPLILWIQAAYFVDFLMTK